LINHQAHVQLTVGLARIEFCEQTVGSSFVRHSPVAAW
jgi:hypothetical protein